jgi:hypothetical protein
MAIWSCQFGNVNWRLSKSTGRFSILAMWTWQARNVHPLGKITKSNNQLDNGTWAFWYWILTRASPPTLSIWPSKHVSHIKVLVTNFLPTPPIRLKPGLQVGGRLLIANHLDQSNYLTNQKHGAVNKYDLTVFFRLFHSSFSRSRTLAVDSLDLTNEPHPKFPVHGGRRILIIGGDALIKLSNVIDFRTTVVVPLPFHQHMSVE